MIQDKNNIEEKVVDYWTKRVADFSDVRENELDSELSREWVDISLLLSLPDSYILLCSCKFLLQL